MSLVHVMLACLARGDRHGYDLRRQYQARFPAARPVAPAQVYSTLQRMQRDGWVRPAATERAGGPDRTLYRLTQGGRTELHRWLEETEAPGEHVANPLFAKVTVALLVADATHAASYLRRQREAHLSRMREHTSRKADPAATLAQVLAADYALNHLDADLRWIDTALDRCASLAKEMAT